ncbi:MAG: hypothetical protein HC819_21145 [Cyclobacteriaceae bacterium]|nr:hypothetical protein [Cyclobacteriaceae bacterium]
MSNSNGKIVFVAETSAEMQAYKQNLMNELEHFGCQVYAGTTGPGMQDADFQLMQQCDVAIHLLSDLDKPVDKHEKGIEEAQIQTSVQYYLSQKLVATESSGFKIFAWHPKSSSEDIFREKKVPRHLMKIQQLEEVELLRTNFEEFKYYLLKSLEQPAIEVSDSFYIKGYEGQSIYFIYDQVDKQAVQPYIGYLKNRGFSVLTPIFEGDVFSIRKMHNSCLKKMDIAVIFSHLSGINWINMKIMDILKSPGLGREKPMLGRGIFADVEKKPALQAESRGFYFCELNKVFDKEPLEAFLKVIDN